MKDIFDRIFSEMTIQGKKQNELASFLGIHKNAVGNWKMGLNTSYMKYIYAIAEFLDVSVEYLKGETDIKRPPIRLDRELSSHESMVITAYREQPEMQPAVDRLLGVTAEEPRSVASGSNAPPAPHLVRNAALGGDAQQSTSADTEDKTKKIEALLNDKINGF